jgi:hypothetical protein
MEDQMIYTRYGSEVCVVGKTRKGTLAIDRKDGAHLWAEPGELKADGGSKEIEEASKLVPIVSE